MYIIPLSQVAPALLVLYTGAMYISGLPIIISIRSTNVYEERSIGLEKPKRQDDVNESERSYIGVRNFPLLSFPYTDELTRPIRPTSNPN